MANKASLEHSLEYWRYMLKLRTWQRDWDDVAYIEKYQIPRIEREIEELG